jgi:hypothetical protein
MLAQVCIDNGGFDNGSFILAEIGKADVVLVGRGIDATFCIGIFGDVEEVVKETVLDLRQWLWWS